MLFRLEKARPSTTFTSPRADYIKVLFCYLDWRKQDLRPLSLHLVARSRRSVHPRLGRVPVVGPPRHARSARASAGTLQVLYGMRNWYVTRSFVLRASTDGSIAVGSILHVRLIELEPVLHNWWNKGCGMSYPVCGMEYIKEPLLLIGDSSPCSCGSEFPLSLSEWSFTICPTPYNLMCVVK